MIAGYLMVTWLTKLNKWHKRGQPCLTPLFRAKHADIYPQFHILEHALLYNNIVQSTKFFGVPILNIVVHKKICKTESKAFL